MTGRPGTTRVYREVGTTRVFASAVDWPGWSRPAPRRARGADDEAVEAAPAALADHLPRYRAALEGSSPRAPDDAAALDVVERVTGDLTRDFGAPSTIPAIDHEPLSAQQSAAPAAVPRACWSHLDAAVATAPAALRTGPGGGGRARDAIAEHVAGAEQASLRELDVPAGARVPRGRSRALLLAALSERSQPEPGALQDPLRETFSLPMEGTTAWPLRYALHRAPHRSPRHDHRLRSFSVWIRPETVRRR